jgi:NADPH2:quinone reductase
VVATTRQPDRVQALLDHGADHVIVDDGPIAGRVRALVPNGVDAGLELVGTPTLPDRLQATRVHGTVCFAGMLSNQWTVPDFYPIEYIPRGVRLTAYGGGSADLPGDVLQGHLDRVATGTVSLGPINVHEFEDIREAHSDLEHNRVFGKHVVLTRAGHARRRAAVADACGVVRTTRPRPPGAYRRRDAGPGARAR